MSRIDQVQTGRMRLCVQKEAFNLRNESAFDAWGTSMTIITHPGVVLEPLSSVLVVNTYKANLKLRKCPSKDIQEVLELREDNGLSSRIVLPNPKNMPG